MASEQSEVGIPVEREANEHRVHGHCAKAMGGESGRVIRRPARPDGQQQQSRSLVESFVNYDFYKWNEVKTGGTIVYER